MSSTFTPGAHNSTSGPLLLNGARRLWLSKADTGTTESNLAGAPTGPPSLPAAVIRRSPLLQAVVQMVSTADGAEGAPKLMLTIRIRFVMPQSMSAMRLLQAPLPEELNTFPAKRNAAEQPQLLPLRRLRRQWFLHNECRDRYHPLAIPRQARNSPLPGSAEQDRDGSRQFPYRAQPPERVFPREQSQARGAFTCQTPAGIVSACGAGCPSTCIRATGEGIASRATFPRRPRGSQRYRWPLARRSQNL